MIAAARCACGATLDVDLEAGDGDPVDGIASVLEGWYARHPHRPTPDPAP